MKTAYCKINLGVLKQLVTFKDNSLSTPLVKQVLKEQLPTLFLKEKGLETVYLCGAPREYLQKIERETEQKKVLNNDYKNKNITFIYSQF